MDALPVVVMLAAQLAVGGALLERQAMTTVLPPAPTVDGARASALGDGEFFFRNGVLKLLNVGVTGGDLVPLRELDYAALAGWMRLLDRLDARSNIVPYLAAYWYGYTPNKPDSRHIVGYLLERAEVDASHGWQWRVMAMHLAKHRLEDDALALEIAQDLAARDDPAAPYWTAHMPAFVLEGMGEREAALILLVGILETKPDLSDDERDALLRAIDRLTDDTSGDMK